MSTNTSSPVNPLNPWNRNTITFNQDPNSPYYIHSSDTSSFQLVSVKFNETGYTNW